MMLALNIGFYMFFCQKSFADFWLERGSAIFVVSGMASFAIAIFRYRILKNNFQQRFALQKATNELSKKNAQLTEAQEELTNKNEEILSQNEQLKQQKEEILTQRDEIELQKMPSSAPPATSSAVSPTPKEYKKRCCPRGSFS